MKDPGAPARTPLYPAPEGCKRPLRVVLVGPASIPGWVRAFLDQAAGYDWLDLTVLAVADAVLPQVVRVSADVRAVVAFEHALLGRNRSLALVPTSPGAEATRSETLPDAVSAARPDLVILLGPHEWATMLATKAPWGCWHVDASLSDLRHAGLSLLAPMLRGENTTQMALMLTQRDGSPIDLAVSWGRTRPSAFLKQREDAFLKLPGLLLRALHRLAGGYVAPASYAAASLHLQSQSPMGHAVGLRAMLLVARAGLRKLMGKRRDGSIGWTLVLRLGGTPLDPESPLIGSHALLRAAKGWWADPCVVSGQGRRLIFVEEMAHPRTNNANIACVELTDGGARRLGVALDEPGHLSFPQVFAWEGEWYMTVESSYDRRVSLYRASGFPLEWVRVRDLVTGRVCVDPTLHHHDGRWYLFTNIAENCNSTSDELFLFVADSLEGEFSPHPASPIVCDVRRARMAGKLFSRDGRLIRPAQDCGPGYGNAVVFNEVLELGPTVYREKQLSRLAPYLTRRVEGCHTYNSDGNVEVLDVFGRPPSGTAYLHVSEGPGDRATRKNDSRTDKVASLPSTVATAAGGHVHTDTQPR
jgi:hypothetical protein